METLGQKFEVDPLLSDVLGHYYVIQTSKETLAKTYHLSPSLEIIVVFNFSDPVCFSYGNEKVGERTIERVGILGPLRQMVNYEVSPAADLLVLPFIYNGFYRFLSSSVGKNADVLREEDLVRHTELLEELWSTLESISDPGKRVEVLQEYLIENLKDSDQAAMPLLGNVSAIHNARLNPVNVMATTASTTERTIQLRFKKYVGYSPKELLRFLKFKQVISHLMRNQNKKVDWIELVIEFGYFDQSHLIKDFKYFTGLPPKEFLKLNDDGSFCISRD